MKKLLLLLPLAFSGLAAVSAATPTPVIEAAEEEGVVLGYLRLVEEDGLAYGRMRLNYAEGKFGQVYVTMNAEGAIRGRAVTPYGVTPLRGRWEMNKRGIAEMKLLGVDTEMTIQIEANFSTTLILGEWKTVKN